jgi:hypothetical protein
MFAALRAIIQIKRGERISEPASCVIATTMLPHLTLRVTLIGVNQTLWLLESLR